MKEHKHTGLCKPRLFQPDPTHSPPAPPAPPTPTPPTPEAGARTPNPSVRGCGSPDPENCLENFLSFFNWFSLSISIAIFFFLQIFFLLKSLISLSLFIWSRQFTEKRDNIRWNFAQILPACKSPAPAPFSSLPSSHSVGEVPPF